MIRSIEPDDYLVVEGPSMMYQSGYYYLFFSGDGFQSENYHVSVARSSTVMGPYTRSESEYFLHTDLVGSIILNIFLIT
jgi:beta-xylosidase